MVRPRRYNRVTDKIIEELRRIVGPAYVIYEQPERLEPYSHDEVVEPKYAHMPECVVRPQSAEEIAAVLKLANRELIPVTPRGAGSGLSGGAVPIHGGIVLLLDRMNRILEIDRDNMMIVVEPGVVTNEISNAVREYGLFYAGYPMSLETCFIGGNVAENAGGAKAVKYGVTGRYVTGLEMVSAAGEIVQLGGKLVKDVTGYDLIQLMVGSEGTLGVFTKIILKLMPLPKASADLLVLFPTTEEAIAAVPRLMTKSGITPTTIEFMDRISLQTTCKFLNETLPCEQAGAVLLISVDGPNAAQVEREYEAIGQLLQAAGAFEVYVADNPITSQRIWRVRSNTGEAFAVVSVHQSNEDLVVPIAAIPALVAGMEALAAKYDVLIPCYGHAGDGNVHTRVVKNPSWTLKQWNAVQARLLRELYELTARLGGRISGEHGIGHKRKKYLPMFLSKDHINLMRRLKLALDPNNILNPGKIVDA